MEREPDRTKPGNRGTYVLILAAAAAAVVVVLMISDAGALVAALAAV